MDNNNINHTYSYQGQNYSAQPGVSQPGTSQSSMYSGTAQNSAYAAQGQQGQPAQQGQFTQQSQTAQQGQFSQPAQQSQTAQQGRFTQPAQLMQQTAAQQGKPPKKKKKGFGSMLAKAAAVAIVFGLVAGSVFTGVSYVGSRLTGTVSSVSESGSMDSDSGSSSSGAESSTVQSDGTLDYTAVGAGTVTDLTDVSAIAEEAMPSIVAITNISTYTYQGYFGQSQTYQSESCGSGIIIAQDDTYIYIVTNNHVVSGADSLTVQFVDDTSVSCEIQGTSSSNDLAVVKVEISSISDDTLQQIKVATIGDSDSLKVGEATIAIGNALGYGQSVTTGIVSALGRTVTVSDGSTTVTNTNLIQTDAAINPGNSGGALLNASGEVIGINSAKYSDTDVEGIGYAIPITDAMEIVNELIEYGEVVSSQTAYLGIQGTDVSEDLSTVYGMPIGVYIYSVISGTGAEDAGLRQGDIITALDGTQVSTMDELKSMLEDYSAGDTVTLTIERIANNGYESMQVQVTLSSMNSDTQ